MSQTVESLERFEMDHRTDESGNLPAEPDDQLKTIIQIDEIKRLSVGDGVMRLPVKQVRSTEESKTIKIICHHPIEGEKVFSLTKPVVWDDDNELQRFLEWYGYSMSGIFQLQTHTIFAKKTGPKTRDWELVKPPHKITWTERLSGFMPSIDSTVKGMLTVFSVIVWAVLTTLTLDAIEVSGVGDAAGLMLAISALTLCTILANLGLWEVVES